jgi:hypothetical protein
MYILFFQLIFLGTQKPVDRTRNLMLKLLQVTTPTNLSLVFKPLFY